MPHAISFQLWNVCENADIIIGGINLVNEEQPYWSSGFWLFKSDTEIQAVLCRIVTISFANSHWLWISNYILATSEEFWLHCKNISMLAYHFQCQQRKEIRWVFPIRRIKCLLISSDCILKGLSWTKPGGNVERAEQFQATLLLIASNMPQRFYCVSPSTQPHWCNFNNHS